MAQENITVKIDLDTTGFEQAMQGLVQITNTGMNQISSTIKTASDTASLIKNIDTIGKAVTATFSTIKIATGPIGIAIAGVGKHRKRGSGVPLFLCLIFAEGMIY